MWCSTKTDPNTMKHVGGSGFWGFCTNENCPTEELRTEKTGTEATIASPLGNMSFMCLSQFFLNFWHCWIWSHFYYYVKSFSHLEMANFFRLQMDFFWQFDSRNCRRNGFCISYHIQKVKYYLRSKLWCLKFSKKNIVTNYLKDFCPSL